MTFTCFESSLKAWRHRLSIENISIKFLHDMGPLKQFKMNQTKLILLKWTHFVIAAVPMRVCFYFERSMAFLCPSSSWWLVISGDTLPPDSIKRFSKPRWHMVVAAWLASLSSSSYTMMIFPVAFFYSLWVKTSWSARTLWKCFLLNEKEPHRQVNVKDTYSCTSLV